MGTSAGGASVSFQVLSPYSSGLFHGAQTISGSVLNSWSLHPNPVKSTEELAEILDCPTQPTSALAECLRLTDFKKIMSVRLAVSCCKNQIRVFIIPSYLSYSSYCKIIYDRFEVSKRRKFCYQKSPC